jgi:hypothetical protein
LTAAHAKLIRALIERERLIAFLCRHSEKLKLKNATLHRKEASQFHLSSQETNPLTNSPSNQPPNANGYGADPVDSPQQQIPNLSHAHLSYHGRSSTSYGAKFPTLFIRSEDSPSVIAKSSAKQQSNFIWGLNRAQPHSSRISFLIIESR